MRPRDTDEKQASNAKLYYSVMLLIIFAIFFGAFAEKVTSLMETIEVVNRDRSVAEFQQTVNAIRSKWLQERRSKVTLDIVEGSQLVKKGSVSFRVNERGYVIGLENGSNLDCQQLWSSVQSQPWSTTLQADTMFIKGEATGCRYRVTEQGYLVYDSKSGQVYLLPID